VNNNTTWTLGRHNIKFVFDIRSRRSKAALGFTPVAAVFPPATMEPLTLARPTVSISKIP
jgi:hypothetical protein